MIIEPAGRERDLQIRGIKGVACPSYEMYFSTSLFDAWPLWEELCKAFPFGVEYFVRQEKHHIRILSPALIFDDSKLISVGISFADVVSAVWLKWKDGINFADVVSAVWLKWKDINEELEDPGSPSD